MFNQETIDAVISVAMKYLSGEMIGLVPFIYLIGYMMKNSLKYPDEKILKGLLVITLVFTILMPLLAFDEYNVKNVLETVLNGFIQGILVTSVSVFGNQWKKQIDKEKE